MKKFLLKLYFFITFNVLCGPYFSPNYLPVIKMVIKNVFFFITLFLIEVLETIEVIYIRPFTNIGRRCFYFLEYTLCYGEFVNV